MDGQGTVLMFVRLGIQWAGGALAVRGIGDDALWQAVGGGVITAAGALWSYMERRKLKAAAS